MSSASCCLIRPPHQQKPRWRLLRWPRLLPLLLHLQSAATQQSRSLLRLPRGRGALSASRRFGVMRPPVFARPPLSGGVVAIPPPLLARSQSVVAVPRLPPAAHPRHPPSPAAPAAAAAPAAPSAARSRPGSLVVGPALRTAAGILAADPAAVPEWREASDPASSRPYWYNSAGQMTWVKPE